MSIRFERNANGEIISVDTETNEVVGGITTMGDLIGEGHLTPSDDRMCPIFKRVIDGELCYEIAFCMQGLFNISSVSESVHIKLKFQEAKKICMECPFGDMS